MLPSSHADGWMDCLFCLLSLHRPNCLSWTGHGDVVAWQGQQGRGVVVTNYTSKSTKIGVWVSILVAWLHILKGHHAMIWSSIFTDKKPPTWQSLSPVSSTYFCLVMLYCDSVFISCCHMCNECWVSVHREVETNSKTQGGNFTHWIYKMSVDLYQILNCYIIYALNATWHTMKKNLHDST